ncbi:MAG: hypothetical protein QM796_15205 [Chthoniobacteraceae bacterium]
MIKAAPWIATIALLSSLAGCTTPASNSSRNDSTAPVKISGDAGVRYQSMSTTGINPEHRPANSF